MKKNGVLLKYASAALRADPDIVLAALQQNTKAQDYISGDLLTSIDSIRALNEAVEINPGIPNLSDDALNQIIAFCFPQTTITGSLFSNATYQKILTLLDCHTDQPNMKP